jgi:hypothetical protein
MALGFLPNKEGMSREIELWIAHKEVDILLSLCNCCIYKAFDLILARECRSCAIRQGILSIVSERTDPVASEGALLDAC